MRKNLLVIGAIAAIVLAALGIVMLRGNPEQMAAKDGAVPAKIAAGEMVLGSADAPVTMIEYASLTCPHCARFHSETLPDLKRDYIDTGKVRLVFRDFPLDGMALKAAMLAHCAGPKRYFGFLGMLFESQASWSQAPDPTAALLRVAKLGGMGEDTAKRCLADESLAKQVLASRLKGERTYKVQSTPTFIINGKSYAGARPFSEFVKILRPLLSGS